MDGKMMRIRDLDVQVDRNKAHAFCLTISPREGKIGVSVPLNTSDGVIRNFVLSRYDCIKTRVKLIREQKRGGCMYYYPLSREGEGKYVSEENHNFPGERYIDNASGPIR